MKILAVCNPKGGCGKTTLATNLTVGLLRLGEEALLVDTDPQGSAQDWHAAREAAAPALEPPVSCIGLDRPNGLGTLARTARGYDWCVIDGAAKLEDRVPSAIRAASIVVIPVQPSPYDIWSAAEVVELVKARQSVTDGQPRACFVVTRAIVGTRLGEDVLGLLQEHGLPVLGARIAQRQIYARTVSEGRSVYDAAPSQSRTLAVGEVDRVLAEIIAEERV